MLYIFLLFTSVHWEVFVFKFILNSKKINHKLCKNHQNKKSMLLKSMYRYNKTIHFLSNLQIHS